MRSLIYDNEKDPNSIRIIRGDLATVSQHARQLIIRPRNKIVQYERQAL